MNSTFLDSSELNLILLRMGLFGATHGYGGKKGPLSNICQTYSKMMKLGTIIPKEDPKNIKIT